MSNKILMGSTYFFSCYEDFIPGDLDELIVEDTNNFKYMSQLHGQGKCLFRLKKQPDADTYINMALEDRLGMVVGKFLIPEACQALGVTIQDLPKLLPLIEKLDSKHEYEKIIYESYLENKAFFLTDSQRAKAYQSYRQTRNLN